MSDLFDETTAHIIREVNGEVKELKYCFRCKEWHPVEEYSSLKSSKDGLQTYCKSCFQKMNRERNEKKKAERGSLEGTPILDEAKEVENPTTVSGKPDEFNLDILDTLSMAIREKMEEKDHLIEKLSMEKKEAEAKAKDLSNLTDRDILTVLTNNTIPLRYLFETIARQSGDQYTFFAEDKMTGMTQTIKLKEDVPPYLIKSA